MEAEIAFKVKRLISTIPDNMDVWELSNKLRNIDVTKHGAQKVSGLIDIVHENLRKDDDIISSNDNSPYYVYKHMHLYTVEELARYSIYNRQIDILFNIKLGYFLPFKAGDVHRSFYSSMIFALYLELPSIMILYAMHNRNYECPEKENVHKNMEKIINYHYKLYDCGLYKKDVFIAHVATIIPRNNTTHAFRILGFETFSDKIIIDNISIVNKCNKSLGLEIVP